jgi:hypothetical protein
VSPAIFGAWVHANAPHTKIALYTAYAICSLSAIAAIWIRCWYTKSCAELPNGWLVRTAASAAPIPVYCLLLVAPFDSDLVRALMEEQVVLAIAGMYGLVETLKDIRGTAADAHIKKRLTTP